MTLGVFRILFAYCLWDEVATTHARSTGAIEGGFHLPYFEWIPLMTVPTYDLVHLLQYPLILTLGIGLLSRTSCGALLVLQGWVFFADQLNYRNHPSFFLLVLLCLLLAPAADALSVHSLVRRWRDHSAAGLWGRVQPLTFQRLIQVQLSLVYLWAALHKLNRAFLDGSVLAHHLGEDLFEGGSGRFLGSTLTPQAIEGWRAFMQEPSNLILAAWITVALELFLAGALWFPATRPVGIGLGTMFHLAIAWGMGIRVFSLAAIACYLLFLDPDTLPATGRRVRAFLRPVVTVGR